MTAISKHIFLLTVGMQINEHGNPAMVLQNVFLYGIDFSTFLRSRMPPATIEIVAGDITSGIAQNNAIRIGHRDDLYDIVLE